MLRPRSYHEHRFESADGHLSLFARDYPAQSARGDGSCTTLLLMHGLTRNSADFEPLIKHLPQTCRLIIPDQRGRGLSDYDPAPQNYRPDVYVDDMWSLIDGLGLDQVICVGTSMGGLMAMVMGAQRSRRIAGIVLNDVGPELSKAGLDRLRDYVGNDEPMADWPAAAQRCEQINSGAMDGFDAHDWHGFAKRTCTELPDGRVKFAYDPAIALGMAEQDTTAVPPDLWAMWDDLAGIPILLIRGANSDILLAETAAEMALKHPDKFWAVDVPGRGHAPLLDEVTARQAISAYLDAVSG